MVIVVVFGMDVEMTEPWPWLGPEITLWRFSQLNLSMSIPLVAASSQPAVPGIDVIQVPGSAERNGRVRCANYHENLANIDWKLILPRTERECDSHAVEQKLPNSPTISHLVQFTFGTPFKKRIIGNSQQEISAGVSVSIFALAEITETA